VHLDHAGETHQACRVLARRRHLPCSKTLRRFFDQQLDNTDTHALNREDAAMEDLLSSGILTKKEYDTLMMAVGALNGPRKS
jgi:hypothetical protein